MADGTSPLGRIAPDRLDRAIETDPPCPSPIALGVPGFLAPRSLGEVKELAKLIALAEWAPECYRDIDGNYLQPRIELAILHGATVGLGPIAAVHAIALIGGTPSIWGDGALSVIEHSGLLEDMFEDYEDDADEGLTAICSMKRRDRATPIVTRFSIAMAERAGLTRSEGPWQTYPERMLRMRARSWTMRDAFADVLRGLQLREEVEDYPDKGGTRPRPGESNPPGGARPYVSPRPRRPPSSNGMSRLAAAPIAVSEPAGGRNANRPTAEPLNGQETHTPIHADGVVTETPNPDALRAGFERATNPPRVDLPAPSHCSPNAPASPKDSEQDSSTEPDRALTLQINPTWGVQKIFQHYRAALIALYDGAARSEPTIARFRRANIAVEQRLRAKLSSRMRPIDAIYRSAGLEP